MGTQMSNFMSRKRDGSCVSDLCDSDWMRGPWRPCWSASWPGCARAPCAQTPCNCCPRSMAPAQGRRQSVRLEKNLRHASLFFQSSFVQSRNGAINLVKVKLHLFVAQVTFDIVIDNTCPSLSLTRRVPYAGHRGGDIEGGETWAEATKPQREGSACQPAKRGPKLPVRHLYQLPCQRSRLVRTRSLCM